MQNIATSLTAFQQTIQKNTLAIESPNTEFGHLGLVLNDIAYKKLNIGESWKNPKEPPSKPTKPTALMGENTDPYEAQEAHRTWQEAKDTYTTFKYAREALKKQIINSVNDEYINTLEDDTIGYTNVTPLELLTHLWNTYGTISESELTTNEEYMKTPWNPPTPIEELFKQLRKGQKFAKQGNVTITDSQLALYAYENIRKTG